MNGSTVRLACLIATISILCMSGCKESADVYDVYPAPGSQNVPPDTEIRVSFSRAMNPESINADTFRVYGTYLGDYIIQSGGNVFGSPPPSPLWASLSLSAGNYAISLDPNSRAYNIEGYNNSTFGYLGENKWNAYVQMWTSETVPQNLAFG